MSQQLWTICTQRYFKLQLRIRSPLTHKQYKIAIGNFSESLGHEATLDDLTDDNVTLMMSFLLEKEISPRTVNERRQRICALWSWLAKRGEVTKWPTVQDMPIAQRTPKAWTESEVARLFDAAQNMTGRVGKCPARLFWPAMLWLAWDTGERIGAILQAKWDHVSGNILTIPAELRKGKRKDARYVLWPETLVALRDVQSLTTSENLLPWPYSQEMVWYRYGQVVNAAGLPRTRYTMFHCIRRTFATQIHIHGGDATAALMHDSASTTRKSYLDPSQNRNQPHDLIKKLSDLKPSA